MLFNGRNNVINFIEDYGSMILEAKRKANEELTKTRWNRILSINS